MDKILSSPLAEVFSVHHSTQVPSYLQALERETHLKISKPQMLTGALQGRFLAFLSSVCRPASILEIGTFTGYGTLCLAEGLTPEGKIFTLEVSEENAWLARKYFALSPYSQQIELLMGDARQSISALEGAWWDMVYIDADKINNHLYFETVWPKVRTGGIVLIDNVFARGAVWKDETEMKPFEKAVAHLNAYLAKLPDGLVLMLPLRDGITAILKQ